MIHEITIELKHAPRWDRHDFRTKEPNVLYFMEGPATKRNSIYLDADQWNALGCPEVIAIIITGKASE